MRCLAAAAKELKKLGRMNSRARVRAAIGFVRCEPVGKISTQRSASQNFSAFPSSSRCQFTAQVSLLLIPGSNCSWRCKRRRKDKKSRRKSATRCVGALQIYFYFLRLLRWKCSKLIDFSRSHWPTSRKVPAFCILKQTHTIAFVHLIWKTKAHVEKMRQNAPTCHEQGHATKSFYDHGTKTKIFRAEKDLFKLSQSFSLLFILKHF